jgi:hypothetical protein
MERADGGAVGGKRAAAARIYPHWRSRRVGRGGRDNNGAGRGRIVFRDRLGQRLQQPCRDVPAGALDCGPESCARAHRLVGSGLVSRTQHTKDRAGGGGAQHRGGGADGDSQPGRQDRPGVAGRSDRAGRGQRSGAMDSRRGRPRRRRFRASGEIREQSSRVLRENLQAGTPAGPRDTAGRTHGGARPAARAGRAAGRGNLTFSEGSYRRAACP